MTAPLPHLVLFPDFSRRILALLVCTFLLSGLPGCKVADPPTPEQIAAFDYGPCPANAKARALDTLIPPEKRRADSVYVVSEPRRGWVGVRHRPWMPTVYEAGWLVHIGEEWKLLGTTSHGVVACFFCREHGEISYYSVQSWERVGPQNGYLVGWPDSEGVSAKPPDVRW